jgi:hypothetical protein
MLNLPITQLQEKYREYAEAIRLKVNPGEITLFYKPIQGLSNITPALDNAPYNIDEFGNRIPLDVLSDRFDEKTDNTYLSLAQETIKVRTYWKEAKFNDANFTNRSDVCKVIFHKDDINKILRAVKGKIDSRDVKLVSGPASYGLFSKDYYVSYWEAINVNQDN